MIELNAGVWVWLLHELVCEAFVQLPIIMPFQESCMSVRCCPLERYLSKHNCMNVFITELYYSACISVVVSIVLHACMHACICRGVCVCVFALFASISAIC